MPTFYCVHLTCEIYLFFLKIFVCVVCSLI